MRSKLFFISLGVLLHLNNLSFARELDNLSFARELNNLNIPIPPNFGLTIEGLCQKYGYKLETHFVTTEDGYILGVHRIPKEKEKSLTESDVRPPILMVHGFLSSSTDWVNNGPDKSLAFRLADEGYDVWLMNMRGNSWSKNHTKLDPSTDPAFWDFSFNEVGLYDIPATIDHILDVTKVTNLTYIGFSEGTTASFVMTSNKTDYNEKLNLLVALAPVAFMTDVDAPILNLVHQYDFLIKIAVQLLNITEIPQIGLLKDLGILLCNEESGLKEICADLIFLIAGVDKEQYDYSFTPVFFSNFPNSASIKSLLHYMQFIKSESFRMFDYGVFQNREIYGSIFPPNYEISKITAPVALYYGTNDYFTSIPDVEKLAGKLSDLVEKKSIDKFNHIDFIIAKDVNKLLFDEVIQLINSYNNK